MVGADVRRRILARKHFHLRDAPKRRFGATAVRLLTSAATALATIPERVLHHIPPKIFRRQSFLENALQNR